ncbi:phosphotransferase family protein [Aspergillus affinis]|uniref:phosphotransferase family protein n=1 Tax=Aspergillus affinis TaxID=1070780 RepID=UPI0022FEA098|nr:uncharacterized protein KD926_005451 [Aspergillus affinis]KAI9034813.1 hypothetical protein KD926_005451 [Aspergillus affinis]
MTSMAIREDIAPADHLIEQRPDLESQVIESLSQTPYKCLSLEQLSGGIANFTFRGSLYLPLQDNRKSVIIKHSLSCEKTGVLDLPVIRCAGEAVSLEVMRGILFKHEHVSIRSPHPLYLDTHANIQVMEDIPNVGTLRDNLYLDKTTSQSTAICIGESLGLWLGEFHSRDWSHVDEDVMATIRENTAALSMGGLHLHFMMDAFHDDLLAKESVSKLFSQNHNDRRSILHGDFSTRNFLLQSHQENNKKNDINLVLVDWELCRYGCVAEDLASMIACLYTQWMLEDTPSAEFILRGFIRGYGQLSEHLIFRLAGLIPVYLVIWGKFDVIIGEKSEARTRELHRHARDFLVGAAQRDVKWLSQSCLSEFLRG